MLSRIKGWKYWPLLKKILITFLILGIYKFCSFILLPGIDPEAVLTKKIGSKEVLNVLDYIAGSKMERANVFAIGIMPYINGSIITQILSSKIGFKDFQNMKKDREMGSMKMNQWTKYFTIFISLISSITFCVILRSTPGLVFLKSKTIFYMVNIPILITGSLLSVWLASQISKYGVGQGISMIIFTNIITHSIGNINKIKSFFSRGKIGIKMIIAIMVFHASFFIFAIFVELCIRQIKIRCLGIQGNSYIQHMNLKINNAGVMTAIMSSHFVRFPYFLVLLAKKTKFYAEYFEGILATISPGGSLYYIFFMLILVVFTITQTEIVFDPKDISSHFQEEGIVVLDHRPGEQTYQYLRSIMNKLTILSSAYLSIICVLNEYIADTINNLVGSQLVGSTGTSILIAISIANIIVAGITPYDYKKLLEVYK